MNPGAPQPSASVRDILFRCDHCDGALVVEGAAAGASVVCGRCGKNTKVPAASAAVPVPLGSDATDLLRKLKENDSQRTEVTGYINQLCIQLHRWKLRLQTLNERKAELESQLASFDS